MKIYTRLWSLAILSAASLLVVGVFSIHVFRNLSKDFSHLYTIELSPALSINSINTSLQATRSRMLAVIVGNYSPVGAAVLLQDERENIETQWRAFMRTYSRTDSHKSPEVHELVVRIDQGMPDLMRYLDHIGKACEAEDPSSMTELLGDDWAELHVGMIKPMRKLVQLLEEGMQATYREQQEVAQRAEMLTLSILVLTVSLLMFVMLRTIRRVTTGVRTIETGLQAVACNRFTPGEISGSDEFAEMQQSLTATARQLAVDRKEIIALASKNQSIVESLGEGVYGTDNQGTITSSTRPGHA